MILALDTSTPVCKLTIITDDDRKTDEWEAGRSLADGLIGFIRETLSNNNATWSDITAIIVFKGPGSFTGLRIGLTVCNTIADDSNIPIVGETGEHWIQNALTRLKAGNTDTLVMPLYGREPNITTPRK